MADPAPQLPALTQAVLDPATLDALFRDLATCTEILSVHPKASPGAHVGETAITLPAARAGLLAGEFRGVQIRYRYESKEWCDTLLASPGGIRIVRICTDDVVPGSS